MSFSSNHVNLVTGASGFLGSWVVRKLVEQGRPVRALLRRSSSLRNLEGISTKGYEIVRGDKTDRSSLVAALAGCRWLFDCAVDVRTWLSQEELDRTNVLGARSLMSAALEGGVERVVVCSAAGTIGRGRGGLATEDNEFDWWNDADPYIRSRVCSEREVQDWVRKGLEVMIVNPAVVWGPGDSQPTPQGRMLIDFIAGRVPFSIPVTLCVADVEDAAEAMIAAAEQGRSGARYLIGDENLPMKDLLCIVAEIAEVPPPRFELPLPAAYGIAAACSLLNFVSGKRRVPFTLRTLRIARGMPPYDTSRSKTELGYRPRPTREVFARTIAWFREHGYTGGRSAQTFNNSN